MLGDDDTTDWAMGQPPPWLDAYGPPPIDTPVVTAPDAAPAKASRVEFGEPVMDPPPASQSSKLTPEEEAKIEIDQTPSAPPQPTTVAPQGPTPPLAIPSFVPPWLKAMEPPQAAAISTAAPAATPPSVDAISGGSVLASPREESPDQTFARIALDPNASIEDRQKALANLPPDQRAQIVNNADPKQLAAIASSTMSPEDLATIAVRHQQAQIHEESVRRLDLARKADEDARLAFQAHQAAIQKADADTMQLAAEGNALSKEKIDPNEHGVGRFIATVLTAALGGAMSQYTGGRNLALEEMDKHTQRRIDAQKADLANKWQGLSFKRNLIAEHLQHSGDLYRAQEAYRISQYDRATTELQTAMQDYDPQGTTAIRAAGAVQQIQAQRAQALQAYNQQQMKNNLELAKSYVEIEQAKRAADAQIETARHNRAQEGIEYGKLGIEKDKAAATKAENVVWEPEQLAQLHPGMPVPPIKMSEKSYGTWLENNNKGLEQVGKGQETAIKESSSQVRNPITGERLDEKGQKLVASPEVAKEVNTKLGTAQNLLDSLSNVRRFLDSDPSVVDRTAWAQAVTEMNNAKVAFIEAHKAKMSSREMEATAEVFGPDFDAVKDRLLNKGAGKARIDALINAAKRETATELKTSIGYSGKVPLLDTSRPVASEPTPADKATSVLSTKPTIAPEDYEAGTDDAQYDVLRKSGVTSPAAAHAIATAKAAGIPPILQQAATNPLVLRALEFGVHPSQIAQLEKTAEDARNAPNEKARQDALGVLQEQAEHGSTTGMRRLAQSYMASAMVADQKIDPRTGLTIPAEPAPAAAKEQP